MEFAGFHLQHQLQLEEFDQCVTSATPHDYKPSTTQSWITSNIYNGCTSGFMTENFTNSREQGHKYDMTDSLRTSTGQDFGFHNGKSFTQQQANDLLVSSPSRHVNEIEFSPPENLYDNLQKPINEGMALTKSYNFGHVSSISNLPTQDLASSLVSCSLGLNSQMLDLHTSYSGSYDMQICYDTFGLIEESISLSHGNMHGLENSPSNSSNKVISSFTREVALTKRPSKCSRSQESEAKAKKSRPSCPSLKVRKENLGDRIQTLQRLVAPFGKTSTVSVLTEAIGYIHFLHEQIQDSKKVDSREFKPDLRSRGLCLVPVSFASSINRWA